MSQSIFERFQVIDTDTHITEPHDVWTARVSSKWGDKIPHIVQVDGRDIWMIGDQGAGGPGYYTMAGFDGTFPEAPLGYADIPKSAYDAHARLAHMDAEGIYAQVLYPNLGGFGSGGFFKLKDPELMLECVRAYNDFLIDWCSADSNRLIPAMASPFWDVDAWVKEIERCAKLGFKAVLGCGSPEGWGYLPVSHKHWYPVWGAAQAAGMNISFHIGADDLSKLLEDKGEMGMKANFSRVAALTFLVNSNCLSELIFGGVCHRFPDLKFVSVESGVGWLTSALEAFDWQWTNGQVTKEHPEYDLLPTEYFKRQIYGCFWFETDGIQKALELYPDNMLWETDFPHPTCQHPGPANPLARRPRDYAEEAFAGVPESTLQKVLHDTPAALYGIQ